MEGSVKAYKMFMVQLLCGWLLNAIAVLFWLWGEVSIAQFFRLTVEWYGGYLLPLLLISSLPLTGGIAVSVLLRVATSMGLNFLLRKRLLLCLLGEIVISGVIIFFNFIVQGV